MRLENPVYIARNHLVEEALTAASEEGDLRQFDRLLAIVKAPFDSREGAESYAKPAPREVTARYRTFCGT
jgi:uncharacterized protein YdiU (UPF0061 family)